MAEAGSRTVSAAERARGLEVRAARSAFQTWEAVGGARVRFEYVGVMSDGAVPDQDDGLNTIVFYTSALPPELTEAIAVTAIIYGDRTGVIYDADILINERDYRFSTFRAGGYVDLESVLLHEGGHLLGLDHTCGLQGETQPSCYDPNLTSDPTRLARITDAVMYPARAPGDPLRRALTLDDMDAAAFLYPAETPMPAPRVDAVTPAKLGGASDPLRITGASFDPGATAHLALGAGERREVSVTEARATELRGVVDPTGLAAGCYDLVVTQPSGKKGGLFGVLSVGGLSCEDPPPPKGSGCDAMGDPSPRSAFAVFFLLWFAAIVVRTKARRRRP